ncbi:MAG: GEVED domain-containing protein [Bacteroidetes bacterium]|nr:GEVED domain-containing protein [Bacteroidota bacterium]
MKTLTYLACGILLLPAGLKSQQFQWARTDNGSNGSQCHASFTDKDGNTYLTGTIYGNMNIQGTSISSTGNNDLFVAKFNMLGTLEWAFAEGGYANQTGTAIAVDNSGNIYIGGTMDGATVFGDTTLISYQAPFTGGIDLFVLKYKPGLELEWARRIGSRDPDSTASNLDYLADLAVDQDQNVIVTGEFYYHCFFGDSLVYSHGENDGFIAKYTTMGELSWVRVAGGSYEDDKGRAVTTDNAGNIYNLTGFHLECQIGDITLQSNGYNIAIIKLLPSGQIVWATKVNGEGWDYMNGNDIDVDNQGSIHITGFYEGTLVFGTDTLNSVWFSAPTNDIFAALLDNSGEAVWGRSFGNFSWNDLSAIDCDDQGNTYLFYNNPDTQPPDDTLNAELLKLDTQGFVEWNYRLGSKSNQVFHLSGLHIDSLGNLYLTGSFSDSAFIGHDTLYSNFYGGSFFIGKWLANNSFLQISSITTLQTDTTFISRGSNNQLIRDYNIQVSGQGNPIGITAIILDTTGSQNFSANISHLRIFYDGKEVKGTTLKKPFIWPLCLKPAGNLEIYADVSSSANVGDTISLKWVSYQMMGEDTFIHPVNLSGEEGLSVVNYCVPVYSGPSTPLFPDNIWMVKLTSQEDSLVIDHVDTTIHGTDASRYEWDSDNTGTGRIKAGDSCYFKVLSRDPGAMICIWADLNQNDQFDNPGERLYFGSDSTGSYYVPSYMTTGVTRIRFMSFNQPVLMPSPCGTYLNGSTLDFSVNLLPFTGKTITGKLVYDNAYLTPIPGDTLKLVLPGGGGNSKQVTDIIIQTTVTDSLGNYSFSNVMPGLYQLIPSVTASWGGVNSIDALLVLKHFVGFITLEGLPLLAGDVNNTGFLNSVDALEIVKRYTGIISSFMINDWLWPIYERIPVNYFSNGHYDLHVLCAGDVNRSYIP